MKKPFIRRAWPVVAGLAMLVAGLTAPAAVATAFARSAAMPSDFNGDGYADLAIGVPGEGIGSRKDAGGVNVMYGSSSGLRAARDQFWSQDSPGILGTSEPGDRFGSTLASGDFDADGYADLAVGASGEVIAGVHGGAVNVIYGSPNGLAASGDQILSQANLPGALAIGGFGTTLAAGDYDGDGRSDLAIGIPWRRAADVPGAGALEIVYGSAIGLTATGAQLISQASTGVVGDPEPWDYFSVGLAAGDLDGDGFGDIVVGARGDRVDGQRHAGGVHVLYGGATGISMDRAEYWSQASPGVPDEPEERPEDEDVIPGSGGDNFGGALAIGDFDDDGSADLAVGVPHEALTESGDGFETDGAVHVLFGTADGLTGDGSQFWHQGVDGIPGDPERDDKFGAVLAAGDFDLDGADDLAIAAPWDTAGPVGRAGTVTLLYGGVAGLAVTGSQTWTQDSHGVPGVAERGDSFGYSLATAEFGRSGHDDLVVGAPTETVGTRYAAGIVSVIYGSPTGLTGIGAQGWSQATVGILGTAERLDSLGSSLAP